MNKQEIVKFAAFIALQQIVWIGCTASQKVIAVQTLRTDLSSYSSIIFSAEANVADDVQKEISDLEEFTILKIKALNIFQRAELGDGKGAPEGSLLVKASINNMRKVGGTKRFMLGASAGRASMIIDVFFIDAITEKTLGSYSITSQSGGTSFSGGINEAVKKAAEGIADLIAQNYKR